MSEKVITSSIDTRAKAKEYLLSKKGVTANILSISDEQMAVYLCDHMNQDDRLALVPAKGVDGKNMGTRMYCPICRQTMDMSPVSTVDLAKAKDTIMNAIQQIKSLANLSESSAVTFAHATHLIVQLEPVYRGALTAGKSNKGFTDFKNGKFKGNANGDNGVSRFLNKYAKVLK